MPSDPPPPSIQDSIHIENYENLIKPCLQEKNQSLCDSFSVKLDSYGAADKYRSLDAIASHIASSPDSAGPMRLASAVFAAFWKKPLLEDENLFHLALLNLADASSSKTTRMLTLGVIGPEVSKNRYAPGAPSVGMGYIGQLDSIAASILSSNKFDDDYKMKFVYLAKLTDTLKLRSSKYTYTLDSSSAVGRPNSLFVYDSQHIFIAGTRGTLLQSGDGGRTWKSISQVPDNNYTGITFSSPDSGWLSAEDALIFSTIDGGKSWLPANAPARGLFAGIHFHTALAGVVFGQQMENDAMVMYTRDGGKTWKPAQAEMKQAVFDMHFLGSRLGWATGSDGALLKTSDGGESWQKINWNESNSGEAYSIQGIHFSTNNKGWAVGKRGLVLRTEDAGQSWKIIPRFFYGNLQGVDFINERMGCIVGEPDAVFMTQDGGQTWERENVSFLSNLSRVKILSSTTGIILSEKNHIIRFSK